MEEKGKRDGGGKEEARRKGWEKTDKSMSQDLKQALPF